MIVEYRIVLTATFATATERDKAYSVLKTAMQGTIGSSALFKRADMLRDDYELKDEPVTEKII
jgi:hypothetical protein